VHAVKLAFVGQREYFNYTSLQAPAEGVEPSFVHFYPEAPVEPLLRELDRLRPDVVFVWRPELIPPGAFADVAAITVGYLTEPLPRVGGTGSPHPDLVTRWETAQRTDPSNFDRIVSVDPLVAPTVDAHMRVWRSFPIPVSDTYFAPVNPPNPSPRLLFTGRSTDHRERFLGPVKKDFATVHLAHGVTDEQLLPFLREADIGVNLHNEPYPTFENRVPAYLAAGLLVVSERLSPHHGLLPGRDLLEVTDPYDLYALVEQASRAPHAFDTIRRSGRRAAERWRASRVYPRFARDLIRDVRAFGRGRAAETLPAILGAA
jgi:hypothetical protein